MKYGIGTMLHPVLYREREPIGPVFREKVREWLWVGWCKCKGTESGREKRAREQEKLGRCAVCRKFEAGRAGARSRSRSKEHDAAFR